MRKTTLFITSVLFMVLFMVGCGSNSKSGPIFTTPDAGDGEVNGYQLVNITSPFDITYAGERKQFKVQLLKYGIPAIGEKILVAGLAAEFGIVLNATAVTDDSGYATFDYQAADPLVNGLYPLEVFYDGSLVENPDDNTSVAVPFRVTSVLEINVQESDAPVGGESLYKLTNVTNPFLVTYAGQEKQFRVQVLKEGVPTANEDVYIASLPSEYGTVKNASAKSDAGGFALFNYVANDPLTNGSYKLKLTHADENGSKVSAVLDMKIDEGAVEFNYQLTNPTTPIKLKDPNQESEISVYLIDENGIGVAGKTVNSSILDGAYGTLNSTVAITDNSGRASFQYKGASSLAGLSSTQLTLSFTENGMTTSQVVDIVVENSTYAIINPTTPIIIKEPSQNGEISAYLVNSSGIGVAGKSVNISILDTAYGKIESTVSVTDESGRAVFKYVGASALDNLTGTQVTISFTENGITVSQVIDIIVDKGFNYNLVNPSTPLIVETVDQKSELSVYLVDSSGVGIKDKLVSITTIDSHYGSISPSSVKTDAAGKALFTYIGPSNLDDLRSTTATLSFTESGLTIYSTIEIKVIPAGSGSDYKLVNARTPISIISPEQKETIDVQLVLNGLPVIDARPCDSEDTVVVDCIIPESIPRSYGRITDAGGSTAKDGYVYYEFVSSIEAEKANVGTEHIFNIIYINKNGNTAASIPITIEMNY
jgi:hypothetical protein